MQLKAEYGLKSIWLKNKTLFAFVTAAIIFQLVMIFTSLISYVQLKKVFGTISKVQYNNYKKKLYVKVYLLSDFNIYYQVYCHRFRDCNLSEFSENKSVAFYTTKTRHKKHKALLSDDPSSGFEYYPIFDINKNKNFFSVLLYNFYRQSLLGFLLTFSLIGSFFYSIPFVATTNWRNRLIILAFAFLYLWLWY